MSNSKRNPRILWTIVLSLFLLFLVTYAGRLASKVYLEAKIDRQVAALEAQKQHQLALQQQLAYFQSEAYIEEAARNELGMVQPGDELLIVVEGPNNSVVEPAIDVATAAVPSFWQKWRARLGF